MARNILAWLRTVENMKHEAKEIHCCPKLTGSIVPVENGICCAGEKKVLLSIFRDCERLVIQFESTTKCFTGTWMRMHSNPSHVVQSSSKPNLHLTVLFVPLSCIALIKACMMCSAITNTFVWWGYVTRCSSLEQWHCKCLQIFNGATLCRGTTDVEHFRRRFVIDFSSAASIITIWITYDSES